MGGPESDLQPVPPRKAPLQHRDAHAGRRDRPDLRTDVLIWYFHPGDMIVALIIQSDRARLPAGAAARPLPAPDAPLWLCRPNRHPRLGPLRHRRGSTRHHGQRQLLIGRDHKSGKLLRYAAPAHLPICPSAHLLTIAPTRCGKGVAPSSPTCSNIPSSPSASIPRAHPPSDRAGRPSSESRTGRSRRQRSRDDLRRAPTTGRAYAGRQCCEALTLWKRRGKPAFDAEEAEQKTGE